MTIATIATIATIDCKLTARPTIVRLLLSVISKISKMVIYFESCLFIAGGWIQEDTDLTSPHLTSPLPLLSRDTTDNCTMNNRNQPLDHEYYLRSSLIWASLSLPINLKDIFLHCRHLWKLPRLFFDSSPSTDSSTHNTQGNVDVRFPVLFQRVSSFPNNKVAC